MIKVGSPMRGDDAASNGSAGEWEDDASPPCPEALWWVVLLNVLLAAAQILVGSTVKSLALVADGAHTLSDAFAAYVALKAESYDGAAYDERKFPFGYARASTIGALINVAALEALCFSIGLNAICRLVTPDTLGDLRALAIVSALGVGVNMFAATLTCCGVRGAHVPEVALKSSVSEILFRLHGISTSRPPRPAAAEEHETLAGTPRGAAHAARLVVVVVRPRRDGRAGRGGAGRRRDAH